MHLTKKQKFGLISFLLLLLAAYLVTKEPWKSKGSELETVIERSTSEEVESGTIERTDNFRAILP